MSKTASTCALIIIIAVALFSTACDKKVVVTTGVPAITGTVSVDSGSGGVVAQAYVSVDGTRLIPVVAVNNETLDISDYGSSGEYMWSSTWHKDRLHAVPGDSCMLHVYQSDGEAKTDAQVIPHIPRVTSPDTGFVLAKSQSLSVTWVATAGVDRYQIEFRLHYYYGNYDDFSLDTTIVVPAGSSTYTLPGSVIFPSYVDSVTYGYCDIYTTAETGPNIGRESDGNVTGKGCGYFFTTSADEMQCSIGSHYMAPHSERPASQRPSARQFVERKKALLANQ